MSKENLFRFVALRPGQKKDPKEFRIPQFSPRETDFKKKIEDKLKEDIKVSTLRDYIQNNYGKSFIKSIEELDINLNALRKWASKHENSQISAASLKKDLEEVLKEKSEALIKGKKYKTIINQLSDTILAESLVSNGNHLGLIEAYKLLSIVELCAGKIPENLKNSSLGDILDQGRFIIPANFKMKPEITPEKEDSIPEDESGNKVLVKRLQELETTYEELLAYSKSNDSRWLGKKKEETEEEKDTSEVQFQLKKLENILLSQHELVKKENSEEEAIAESGQEMAGNLPISEFILDLDVFKKFKASSQAIIQSLHINPKKINVLQTLNQLEEEMAVVSRKIALEETPNTMIRIGNTWANKKTLKKAIAYKKKPNTPSKVKLKSHIPACRYQVGIGDLLIVKQQLKAYELGDFAHVENVLKGELRDRTHRRLNREEEVYIEESEVEIQEERNLQSTQRNELQTEAERTVKSQLDVSAGLKVSGSYGPVAEFSASLDTAYSRSVEHSQKRAASFSRQVVEQSSEKIKERVREEQSRKFIQEIEETNRHSINNATNPTGHIRGIYRWLNKIYDAQVYNYGQRMMYEFTIPEPATYLLHALIDNPSGELDIVQPEEPSFRNSSLKPENIGRSNYQYYVSKYKVEGTPPPPSEIVVSSHTENAENAKPSKYGRAGKISIPEGYKAYGATVQGHRISHGSNISLHVHVGGRSFNLDNGSIIHYQGFHSDRLLELSYTIIGLNISAFSIGIDVWCNLSRERFQQWQQEVYDSIMQAYNQQKVDYEEKLAALEIQQGSQEFGRNPLENKNLMEEELKKLVMNVLEVEHMGEAGYRYSPPQLDLSHLCEHSKYVRFFENAFEWNNMLYVLYPYFWGRESRWSTALQLTDSDPDFAAFLKAGAARIQVPVRPGFEEAIAAYCQTGIIWNGHDIPLRDDDLYVPIINEITENLNRPGEERPYPEGAEPWEVTVPTSLVLVQDLGEIPGIRDSLTGETVTLNEHTPESSNEDSEA